MLVTPRSPSTRTLGPRLKVKMVRDSQGLAVLRVLNLFNIPRIASEWFLEAGRSSTGEDEHYSPIVVKLALSPLGY